MTKVITVIGVALCAALVGGCAQRVRSTSGIATDPTTRQVVFLTRDGCAASATMRANVDAALRTLGVSTAYAVIDLADLSDRDPRSGYPTPTVLYANRDIFDMPEPPVPHPPAT